MKKKILKISFYILGILIIIAIGCFCFYYYKFNYKYKPKKKYTHSVEYINPETALLNDGFIICNEKYIAQYYNPKRARYSKGKNGLRKFILSNYKNKDYTDSGYLNIRFIINCHGKAGRYIIHENNLDLEPIKFNPDLVNQLFNLTTQLKKWIPNYIHGENRDSYMYISYRIENGEITEIIP